MATGIYKLDFSDGTYYIGQAVDIDVRYKQHCKELLDKKHSVKMNEAFCKNARILPKLSIMIECHRDYLDIFECFFIYKYNSDRLLNTTMPKDILGGLTQSALDTLVENRFNSIINIIDILATQVGKIEGLKISLEEAEDEIDRLEHRRSLEELERDTKKRIRRLQDQVKFLTNITEEKETSLRDLENQYADVSDELRKLKSKGFWARIFG
jgi:prefoldin subunit 5